MIGGFVIQWYYVIIVILLLYLFSVVNILREYERGVIFRLGRLLSGTKGPGLILVFWPIDKIVKVDLRTITMDIPPQDIITRDNVTCKVNAVSYFRVVDASRAVVEVENYMYATSQLAQTTLRSVLGEVSLDELLSEREKLNMRLQEQLDKHTDPWGIKVALVEMKQVDLPTEMQRAMAKQAEAERERRAKVIHADGEFQASQKLQEASKILSVEPAALQLRYLQTLTEIGTEKNTTVVFPLPLDLINFFLKKTGKDGA
ncbi:MAG: slipin family protein [Deltaproteobacteria bacterium]|nr:slipin family protein [Deltaproteobacteria bacterium]